MDRSRLSRQWMAVTFVILVGCCSCRAKSGPGALAVDWEPADIVLPKASGSPTTRPTQRPTASRAAAPTQEIPWPPVGNKAPDCTLHASSEVRAPGTRTGTVVGLAFSPDGATLASVTGITSYIVSLEVMLGSESNLSQVVVSDAATGRQLRAFADESRLALKATFSSGGKLLAFGAADGAVHLWDVAAGKLLHTLKGHRGPVYSTAFSPDGKTLASGSADGTVVLWDVASGRAQRTLGGHDSWVTSLAFSPDGKALAAGTSEQAVVLWDVPSSERRRALEMPAKHVSHVAFSPNGRLLAAASPGGRVVLWDPSTGAPQTKLYTRISAGAIAFSPDGSLLAVSRPGRVLLWSVRTEGQVHELVGHDHTQYTSITFAPDGRTVAAGAPDGSVTLWQMAPSTEYCQVRLVSSRVAGAPPAAPRASPSPVPPARPPPLPTSTSAGGDAPDLSGLGTMVFGRRSGDQTVWLLSGERAPVALTEGKGARLSPDGCTLLVSRGRKRPPYGTEYLLMDVNTANPRAAHLDHKPWGSSTVAGVAWNPDSESLTFTTSGSVAKTSWSGSLYRIDAADGRITRITDRGAGRPLYSPDGRWIATTTPEIGYSHGSIGLWGAEGQGGRKLFDKVWPRSIRWAADSSGFFVAFTWLEGGKGSELFWVPVPGQPGDVEPVQLGHLPVDNVTWLPGGMQYTYYTDRLRRANWDGSEDVEVPEPEQEGAAAFWGISGLGAGSWSPDGRWRFTRGGLLDMERLDVFVPLTMERFHGWLDDTHYLAGAALTEGTELYYCEIPENCRLILQMDDTLSWASYSSQRCRDERGEIPEVPYPPTREADVVAYHRETMLMQGLDFGARLNAASALAQMGPVEGAISALVEAMQEDPAMRWVSAQSLESYGPDAMEAVPALIEAMEDGCGADREPYCPLESEKLVEALQSITGQEHGPDAATWRAWWDERR